MTPQEKSRFLCFYNDWNTTYLMGLWRKSHDTAQHFVRDTVQVLGEPDILFASLRLDVRLSTGRTVFVGGKEAEVGGRRAGKF